MHICATSPWTKWRQSCRRLLLMVNSNNILSEVCSLVSDRRERIFATLERGGAVKPENPPVSSKKGAYHLTKHIDLDHPHKSFQSMSETASISRPWTIIYIYIYIYHQYVITNTRQACYGVEAIPDAFLKLAYTASWLCGFDLLGEKRALMGYQRADTRLHSVQQVTHWGALTQWCQVT